MKARLRMKSITQVASSGARSLQEDHTVVNREKGIFVLADGFGGPQAGDAASKGACVAVSDFLRRESGDDEATFPFIRRSYYSLSANVLFNSFIHANRLLLKANKGKSMQERGGASVVAGFVDNGILSLANVGTCGAWLFRSGSWAQLLTPRSFSRMIDPFSSESEDLDSIPMSAMGMADDLEPEVVEYFISPNDVILVHSDGVLKRHRDQIGEVMGIYKSMEDVGEWIKQMIQADANQAQLPDNSSVLLIQF